MALVFEYSDPNELYEAQMEAVNENASLHLEYEMQKVQMEHELRLHDIETRALLENYSDDILEALYEKEMELFMEAEDGIIQKIINWLSGIIKAIFGIKAENPEAMVVVPDPAETKTAFAKARDGINKVKGAIRDHKLISGVLGAGVIGGAALAIKKASDNKKEVKAAEAEALKDEGARVLEDAKKTVEDAKNNNSSEVTGLINEMEEKILKPLTNLLNKFGSAIGGKKDDTPKEGEEQQNSGNENNGNKDTNGNAENQNASNNHGKETNKGKGNLDDKTSKPKSNKIAAVDMPEQLALKKGQVQKDIANVPGAPKKVEAGDWKNAFIANYKTHNSKKEQKRLKRLADAVGYHFNPNNADNLTHVQGFWNALDKAGKNDSTVNSLITYAKNIKKADKSNPMKISFAMYEREDSTIVLADGVMYEFSYDEENDEVLEKILTESTAAEESEVEMMDAFEMAELSFDGEEEKTFESVLEESAESNEDLEELNKLLENL